MAMLVITKGYIYHTPTGGRILRLERQVALGKDWNTGAVSGPQPGPF